MNSIEFKDIGLTLYQRNDCNGCGREFVNHPLPMSEPEPTFNVSKAAASHIAKLIAHENAGTMFRVAVNGGGCSGYQYDFSFDDAQTGDDILIERDGAKVVVDQVSLGFLAGSEIDFVEGLMGSHFEIKNPNAKSSCGCGTSFSV